MIDHGVEPLTWRAERFMVVPAVPVGLSLDTRGRVRLFDPSCASRPVTVFDVIEVPRSA